MTYREIEKRFDRITRPSSRGDRETAAAEFKALNQELAKENKELDWRAWSIWHYFELFDRTSRRVLNRWKRAQLWF
jgi:hypothetical protein